MSGLLAGLSPWTVAVVIFLLRVCDVSLGTMRTISVVDGRTRLAVALGFFEVLIWITAVSEVVVRIQDNPFLILAFAGGFATGNAAGIALEKRLAIGLCVVRMISVDKGDEIARAIHPIGRMVTTFHGTGPDERRSLVYAICPRRDLEELLACARRVEPGLFHAVERFPQTSETTPLFAPTGWRAVMKKK
jgi:uncharacterized protein YebE (UPF0316 family)